jgi:hypothetical protein
MNWQKITIWSLIISIIVYAIFYYIANNTGEFCYEDHWGCYEKLKFGLAFPIAHFLKYTIYSLIVIVLLPNRYKKTAYVTFSIISFFVFVFVYILPIDCTGYMCFNKASGALFIRNLYPIVLIPTLIISFFRFRRQDKKLLSNK